MGVVRDPVDILDLIKVVAFFGAIYNNALVFILIGVNRGDISARQQELREKRRSQNKNKELRRFTFNVNNVNTLLFIFYWLLTADQASS